ncbi:MAG: UDP-N-acetylmuramate--L-alanine ligase [Ginsengibacter sp.]
MIDIKNIKNIYFIGIGGIGMSAIARHFKHIGANVAGYDKTQTLFTKQLESEGMNIHYDDNLNKLNKEADVIVYTPAIPQDHAELNYYKRNNFQVLKRSDILQLITADTFNICISGTHGKTTVSTMVAHILTYSNIRCTAFLGGISVNYKTNYLPSNNNICVIEADEYDRSFLKLSPNIASISSMDPDHLDIYHTGEAVENAFLNFAENLKSGGILISKLGLAKQKELKHLNAIMYSLYDDAADVYSKNITIKDGGYNFDIVDEGKEYQNFQLNVGGMHNVENAVLAIKICLEVGTDIVKIKEAVSEFKGVKRRFEYVVKNERLVFIDDYAHHPEELRALINSAKQLFPSKKCTVIFQPHLFTRTKDLAGEFAEALSLSDHVVLLPIYPARELPIEGITSNIILDKLTVSEKYIIEKEHIIDWGRNTIMQDDQLLIVAGAGDIDQLVEPLKNVLTKNE